MQKNQPIDNSQDAEALRKLTKELVSQNPHDEDAQQLDRVAHALSAMNVTRALYAALWTLRNHWREFGPEYGYDELVETVATNAMRMYEISGREGDGA